MDVLYLYSVKEEKWENILSKGKNPMKRINSILYYNAPLLFLYGGNNLNKTFNDLYVLNTDDFIWKRFFSLEGPSPR